MNHDVRREVIKLVIRPHMSHEGEEIIHHNVHMGTYACVC